MDSHSFRVIGGELLTLLEGARLEKIHGPRLGLLACVFFAGGKKRRLLLRFERQDPLLFFSDTALENPARPPAWVMRLRKYCGGRRLGRGSIDYAGRRLLFPVHVPSGEAPRWLLLDMVDGPSVCIDLPEGFAQEPAWPEPALVDALCATVWRKGETQGPWQDYAVLTPLLRESLAALEALEGRALMVDLQAGGGGLFFYADSSGLPTLYAAWPLPEALCAKRGIIPCAAPKPALQTDTPLPCRQEECCPALSASSRIDERKFFAELGRAVHKESDIPVRKAAKKQFRLLARLDQEALRLNAMLAQREDAVALQAELWRYAPDARLDSIELGGGENGPSRRVALNSLLSLRENMARMFKESSRGARGLAILEARRAEFLSAPPEAGPSESTAAAKSTPKKDAPADAGPKHFPLEETQGEAIRNVGRFRSSDGFLMLRGKNAQGNQSLLKIGKPHDLWLHAEDGPSAHLIIRCSHAAEEVPERSLREAAALVAEKSWQRHEAKARIMVAQLGQVRAVKGAHPGTVRVDKVLCSLVVTLGGED